jgi:hypothetical protein
MKASRFSCVQAVSGIVGRSFQKLDQLCRSHPCRNFQAAGFMGSWVLMSCAWGCRDEEGDGGEGGQDAHAAASGKMRRA